MARLPETGPSLRRFLTQRKRQANRAGDASPYTRSGMSVTAEGRIEATGQMQSSDYDGASRADLGTAGWMLGPDDGGPSLLALNGVDVYADLAAKDVTILGLIADLAAKDVQILDLIASVIYPDFGYANGSGYALPAGQASRITRATVSVPVPAGYTRALVSASALDGAYNSNAGFDYLHSYVSISGGLSVYAPSATVPPGYYGTSFASTDRLLTGLVSGGFVTFQSQPYTTDAAWAASPDNSTTVSATCLFLR